MPGFDRTGPEGRGSMTGRGAGYCAGNETPRFANRGFGYGRGRGVMRGLGRGFGFGWGRRGTPLYPQYDYESHPLTKEEEIQSLKTQSDQLQKELDSINKRVQELNK
ncbi:MAG: DUF5320 domain-containing protein [Bacteroidales bacterium]|nr:DUF5320 domain-containing protein [Bacteroidales bacterium]